jgi:AraC-like DNA-binding protein
MRVSITTQPARRQAARLEHSCAVCAYAETVLAKETLHAGDGFEVVDVRCGCGRGGWSEAEESRGYGIVFVRSGCFRRTSDGVAAVLDPATVYFEAPGREQRIAHPHDGGDRCTAIELAPDLVLSLLADTPELPLEPVFTTPAEDLEHRRLLTRTDQLETEERVVSLAASVLSRVARARVAAGRPRTSSERRRLAGAAREVLAREPAMSLVDVARRLAVSPHHLSRVFAAETGESISRHRNRIRARLALERIADGEPSLARLAAELGFADHAHLTRVVRSEAGAPPAALRHLLRRR